MDTIMILLIVVFLAMYLFQSLKNTLLILNEILDTDALQPLFIEWVKIKRTYNKEFFLSPFYMCRDLYLWVKETSNNWLSKSH